MWVYIGVKEYGMLEIRREIIVWGRKGVRPGWIPLYANGGKQV